MSSKKTLKIHTDEAWTKYRLHVYIYVYQILNKNSLLETLSTDVIV